MEKELAVITLEEKDEYMTLISLSQSYDSLINIASKEGENFKLIDVSSVINDRKKNSIRIEKWWEKTSNKYGFPMYNIEKMFVNFNNNIAYVII